MYSFLRKKQQHQKMKWKTIYDTGKEEVTMSKINLHMEL